MKRNGEDLVGLSCHQRKAELAAGKRLGEL